MKELIEDYKRRLATVTLALLNMKDKSGSIQDIKKFERLTTKASGYNTIIAELEKVMREGISTSEIFCIQTWYGQSIDRVYLDKEIAQQQADEDRARWRKHRRDILKDLSEEEFEKYYEQESRSFIYKVQDLQDAISDIKEDGIMEERHQENY